MPGSWSGRVLAIGTIRLGTDVRPFSIDPRRVPRRDPSRAIGPIDSLDDLIDTVARVIERVEPLVNRNRAWPRRAIGLSSPYAEN